LPIPFSLRQLEYFVAVAAGGSVRAAAARCNVSQPSISVAISDLEATLGKVLFRRQTGHRLMITPAGRRLLKQARTTLAAASQISLNGPDTSAEAVLSIACFRDLGSIYLPRMLQSYAEQNPKLSCLLTEGDLVEIRSKLLDGRCELAITYDIDLKKHGIACQVIDRLQPHILLAAHHPKATADCITLADLLHEQLIIEDFPVTLDYFIEIFRRNGLHPPRIQSAPSFEMQRGLVGSGYGVGLSCVRPKPNMSYDGSPLVCVALAEVQPAQSVVLAHLGEATLSEHARMFLKHAWTSVRDLQPVDNLQE
jgi:DNA-binding transcriptional LysR family regulator